MIRLRFVSAAIAAILSSADSFADTPHPAVCRVIVTERDGTAFGSGTLVDARDQYGLVVTNWHVVRDATGPIHVVFPDGFRSEGRPLKVDEHWDLAALLVWRPATEPAPIAPAAPQPGEPLVICGYGQGDYRAAAGRCTQYFAPEEGMPHELVELSVEARQGDSGGPIFNSRGQVAGVLFGAGRGTTLGSFGGRVQSFLATLAPDIGRSGPAPVVVARPATRPSSAAIDPFQLADARGGAAPAKPLAPVERPRATTASVTPPVAWQTASHEARPSLAASTPLIDFGLPSAASTATAGAIDLSEDSRTLLALAGLAAVAVQAMKLVG
ncbi:MAG: trypsin-like peptidase domain-containing protein [Lacipirellulaceae bacterium]